MPRGRPLAGAPGEQCGDGLGLAALRGVVQGGVPAAVRRVGVRALLRDRRPRNVIVRGAGIWCFRQGGAARVYNGLRGIVISFPQISRLIRLSVFDNAMEFGLKTFFRVHF